MKHVAPAPSRSGVTSPFGKLTERQEGFRVEPHVKEKFAQRAAALDKPAAELLRDIYRVVALGPDEVKRLHDAGLEEVVRMVGGMSNKP